MAELPELGKNCSKNGCNQLDFLPLWCSHCNQVFCKDHHSVGGHSCTKSPSRQVDAKLSEGKWWKCSVVGCKSSNDPVHLPCPSCGAHLCLQHRHEPPESHLCSSVSRQDVVKEHKSDEQNKKQFKDAFSAVEKEIDGRLQTALTSKRTKDKEMACRLRLMRLKSRAIGDPSTSVPLSSRAHFDVFPPSLEAAASSSVSVYVSKTWSIGRATDAIEKILKPQLKSGQKLGLYVYSNKNLVCSDMSQTVGSLIESGNLVDGETLLLDLCN
ncbi:AN1-type zinc finger protein 1-like [Hetaerina americana]|uniref:AN1-type zinc finger protein 1-like n=1 Tax=Hetaerina americana TaxID=62018 RepID=UPI003A7F5451